jgi:hypothetical protein
MRSSCLEGMHRGAIYFLSSLMPFIEALLLIYFSLRIAKGNISKIDIDRAENSKSEFVLIIELQNGRY